MLYINQIKNKNVNLPIYGVNKPTLVQYEKKTVDINKGIESKEPDDLLRLEEEDLIKINLDEAICGLSDYEEDSNPENVDISGSSGAGTIVSNKEESKWNAGRENLPNVMS